MPPRSTRRWPEGRCLRRDRWSAYIPGARVVADPRSLGVREGFRALRGEATNAVWWCFLL